jgi:hypothetical protein
MPPQPPTCSTNFARAAHPPNLPVRTAVSPAAGQNQRSLFWPLAMSPPFRRQPNHVVVRAGHVIDFSPTEFELHPHPSCWACYSKAQILPLVWGFDRYDRSLVEVYVSYLCHKLEAPGPRLIFTEPGSGYVLRR